MADTRTKKTTVYTEPHYAAATKDGWGQDMLGTDTLAGEDTIDHAGIFGLPMTNFTIEANGIKKARVRNKKGRWLPYGTGFDKTNGLGDGTPITGLEIVGSGFIFSVHLKGGNWTNPIRTSDVEGEVLGGMGTVIDGVWVDIL